MKPFKLDNQEKISSGFKVPDGYFENFSAGLLAAIEKPEVKVIPLPKRGMTWMYAAAAVLILALAIPSLNVLFKPSQPDSEILENYIAYYTDISNEELVNLLEPEDIDKIIINYKIEDQALEEALALTSDLENYIIE